MTENDAPRLTALAHGGGCGCKIAPDLLREIVGDAFPTAPGPLIVDAAASDDAAVYRLSEDRLLIATTDFFTPIVDDPFDFGRIAATNALSDIYAMGGQPIFCLAIVGMPIDKLPRETIRDILAGGRSVCRAAGAPIAGGHSIDAAEPIYGLVALGLALPEHLLRNDTAKAGDVLILGKPLGIGVFSAALKKGALDAAAYETMIASTTLPNAPGGKLGRVDGVRAMTDVTGFGLLGHLAEMCRGSGVGAVIDQQAVPIFDAARDLLARGFKTGAGARNWNAVEDLIDADLRDETRDILTDPQTSGGLLVSCAPDAAKAVLAVFRQHGHEEARVIGRMEEGPASIRVE